MPICKYCGKEFNEHGLSNHIKFCSSNPCAEFENREYLKQNAIRTCKIIADRKRKEKELDELTRKDRTFICPKCGKEFSLSLTDKEFEKGKYRKYCSRACANSRTHSEETLQKIRESSSKEAEKHLKIHKCVVCNSEYTTRLSKSKMCCSDKCYQYYKTHRNEFLSKETLEKISEGGRKGIAAQGDARRSKMKCIFVNCVKKILNQ